MPPVLSVADVQSFIGPFHILQGVSLEVHQGEAVVVLGRNGAGKSTLMKTIIGLIKPTSGSIRLQGADISSLPTHAIARKGITYVPEDGSTFALLTVEENMRLAAQKSDAATRERLAYALDLFPDLKSAYKRYAGTLSGGQKQMLAIARALLNDTVIMLIDEPSKGLSPLFVEKVAAALTQVKQRCTFVLVEQNFALASAVGDRYYMLNNGQSVHSGLMSELAADQTLQTKYLSVSMQGGALA